MERIEQTLTSMEVADMIEREHNALLRTIRIFISHMKEIAECKNAQGEKSAVEDANSLGLIREYFIESSYEDANGQSRPCYNVTKKGCEFIANKLTGQKGTEFTRKYFLKRGLTYC